MSAVAIIPNGESLSAVVEIGDGVLIGVSMPAEWTRADLTFQVSYDGETLANAYDASGNEIEVKAGAERYIAIDSALFLGASRLKIRSGSSANPVNQAAEREIAIVFKRQAQVEHKMHLSAWKVERGKGWNAAMHGDKK